MGKYRQALRMGFGPSGKVTSAMARHRNHARKHLSPSVIPTVKTDAAESPNQQAPCVKPVDLGSAAIPTVAYPTSTPAVKLLG